MVPVTTPNDSGLLVLFGCVYIQFPPTRQTNKTNKQTTKQQNNKTTKQQNNKTTKQIQKYKRTNHVNKNQSNNTQSRKKWVQPRYIICSIKCLGTFRYTTLCSSTCSTYSYLPLYVFCVCMCVCMCAFGFGFIMNAHYFICAHMILMSIFYAVKQIITNK